jgi:isoquinoline 1-oxidoreductase subunit beta
VPHVGQDLEAVVLEGGMTLSTTESHPLEASEGADGISRRRFIGYALAASVVVGAADLSRVTSADASIPTVQPVDYYDLSDLLTDASLATAALITITVNTNGTVSFALPRAEVGQGLTTAITMIIAEELSLPMSKVEVTLADAEPLLEFNQLTGGSNSIHSLFDQVRVAAAVAQRRLSEAAARALQAPLPELTIENGTISANGRTIGYGTLTGLGAVTRDTAVLAELKPQSEYKLIGQPQQRIDALEAITGKKQFAMDLDVAGALPTMLCRPPTINGRPIRINNHKTVSEMDGVTDVVLIPHTDFVPGGVAVRAETFGQCIDAVRALDVTWGGGPVDDKSDADVLSDLIKAELPLTPALTGNSTLDQRFTFYFRAGDPLETNCAIADVRADSVEVWSSLKSPIFAQQRIAAMVDLPQSHVAVHVTQGGGSFGRHLFADAAFEAVAVSQAMGKPVKLMWHRTDNFRHGRVHPMCTSRVRMSYSGSNVVAFDQRHTSVATDFSHGLGEILSATLADVPEGDFLAYSQSIFLLTANVPYNFGLATQLLNEVYDIDTFHTSSVRNIYSPEVTCSRELMVDQMASKLGKDPLAFRLSFLREPRMVAVLNAAAKAAGWGSKLPAGIARGIGLHHEYKGYAACVVELDCRPKTVNRKIKNGHGGPRVSKVTFAVDVGLPINPLGLEAQMMGGAMDGIAQALSYSLHLKDGHFLEGSWDNAYYTREWNAPLELEVIVMPANSSEPGGAGELGVAATMAAVGNAYARATGKMPTSFPINHLQPLGFTPLPTVPSIPQSPTNGLAEEF